MTATPTALKIDFVSDVSCPWCVIGLKALEQAADRLKDQVVLDLHFQKDGTDIFKGWKTDECTHNLAAITALFQEHGIAIAPRVMSMAEAYA